MSYFDDYKSTFKQHIVFPFKTTHTKKLDNSYVHTSFSCMSIWKGVVGMLEWHLLRGISSHVFIIKVLTALFVNVIKSTCGSLYLREIEDNVVSC